MAGEFPNLPAEDLKKARITEAKMLEGGAEYDDKGLVVTEQQVESAKGDMAIDILMRRVDDIFKMSKEDLDRAVTKLQDEVEKIDESNITYEQSFKKELLGFLKRARSYANYRKE